jgi:predicted RNA binding protein YcfA (HicA-like mRNA interferase family)
VDAGSLEVDDVVVEGMPVPTKFRDLAKMLKADGWEFDRATGSHYVYKHPTKGTVTVPFHGGNNEIAPGTLKAILKQTGIG